MRYLWVTLGDPYSINIEAITQQMKLQPTPPHPVLLVGHEGLSNHQLRLLGAAPLPSVTTLPKKEGYYLYPISVAVSSCDPKVLSAKERGEVAVASLDLLKSIPKSESLAVLSAPIDKYAASLAGFPFPGQTEYFANLWQAEALMVLSGPRLRVGLVTTHVPLIKVPALLTIPLVEKKILQFATHLQTHEGKEQVRVGVCGLNPHASDGGLFGEEEAKIIAPAIARASSQTKALIEGPLPADTAFFHGYQGDYEGVLAMYHDQGLGPLKTVHFYDAVNISSGLPHLRVSCDHGPAKDLYLTGKANFASFLEAFRICFSYLNHNHS